MTTLPGANVRLLSGKSTVPLVPRFQNFHTMVGTLRGTESWFTPSGRSYSHFGVGGGGEVWQWQDLDFRAASDREGNPYSVSWETEDHGPHFPSWDGSDVPSWTDNQLDSMANGGAWVCLRLGIPAVDVTHSLPIPHGLSIHRYGIDPWRLPSGLRYSSANGKVCPGDRRVHQFKTELVPEIYRRVHGVTGGVLMALSDNQQEELLQLVRNIENRSKEIYTHTAADGRLREVTLAVRDLQSKVNDLAARDPETYTHIVGDGRLKEVTLAVRQIVAKLDA